MARNSERLRAAGQHLKRGLLLYGPPGVGKTHTVRYLVGELVGTTIVELTGETLGADPRRLLDRAQPPAVDDRRRGRRPHRRRSATTTAARHPLLFTLLNEMDGLAEDADVVFLLTTNRADLLEPALASRPGRVDQAVAHRRCRTATPRRRLVAALPRAASTSTSAGSTTSSTAPTGSPRRSSRSCCAAPPSWPPTATPPTDGTALAVTADDLDAALDELLDTRNQMTRAVLGFRDGVGRAG